MENHVVKEAQIKKWNPSTKRKTRKLLYKEGAWQYLRISTSIKMFSKDAEDSIRQME